MALHIQKILEFHQSPHAKSETCEKSPNGTVEVGLGSRYTSRRRPAFATGVLRRAIGECLACPRARQYPAREQVQRSRTDPLSSGRRPTRPDARRAVAVLVRI